MILRLVVEDTLAVAALMLVLWAIHLLMKNAAVVDAGWAGGLAVIAVIDAAASRTPRALLLASMVFVWGTRLALYLLFTRVIGQPEEGRYRELRSQWKTNIALKFLAFFEFQALLCVLLSGPLLLTALNPFPAVTNIQRAAAALWLVSLIGEIAADGQLAGFKARPQNRGKVCDAGLWKYSRHPNYFFESLIWISYALFAIDSPWGWVGLLSPALILYFLLRVTGIPATEAQALRSKGDAYRRYQQTTSMFIPWLPRKWYPRKQTEP